MRRTTRPRSGLEQGSKAVPLTPVPSPIAHPAPRERGPGGEGLRTPLFPSSPPFLIQSLLYMRIQVLGGYGGESLECRMTCLLINGRVALDAGSLSQALSVERQVAVHTILLSHSHMDHTNSLPFFIENVYGKTEKAIDIHGSPATIYAIRKYLFNNATWPDFTRLPNHLLPAMRFLELESEVPVVIDGVSFTPIPVSHTVPTHGFLIEQ